MIRNTECMENNGDVVVLVAAHKMFDDSFLPNGYQVVKVGDQLSALPDKKGGAVWVSDDTGDNISSENRYYCELTAQYWGWKNLNDSSIKYMGLSHYRRYFFDYKKSSKNFQDDILSETGVVRILEKHKIIIPYLSVKTPRTNILYENIPESKQDKDWVLVESIVMEHFSEYADDFHKAIYGKYIAYGNMFITSKEYFAEYSKWLFSVLKYYDEAYEKQNKRRRERMDGDLAEALLLVWVYHNFNKKDIYWMEVRNTESGDFPEYSGKGLKHRLRRFTRTYRFILRLYRKLSLCYALLKKEKRL